MTGEPRSIQTIRVADGGDQLRTVLNDVRRTHERVLVEDDGGPVAAIISATDFEKLIQFEAERERDFAVVGEMNAAFADVPFDEIEAEAAKALAEVRAEMRHERQGHSASAE